jgi:hypothetical protein
MDYEKLIHYEEKKVDDVWLKDKHCKIYWIHEQVEELQEKAIAMAYPTSDQVCNAISY